MPRTPPVPWVVVSEEDAKLVMAAIEKKRVSSFVSKSDSARGLMLALFHTGQASQSRLVMMIAFPSWVDLSVYMAVHHCCKERVAKFNLTN